MKKAIEEGGEASAFFEEGGEGAKSEGEDDGAEAPAAPADFLEEVVFKKTTNGEDGRGSSEEESACEGGAEEGEGSLAGEENECERNEGWEQGDEVHDVGSEAEFKKKGDRSCEGSPF